MMNQYFNEYNCIIVKFETNEENVNYIIDFFFDIIGATISSPVDKNEFKESILDSDYGISYIRYKSNNKLTYGQFINLEENDNNTEYSSYEDVFTINDIRNGKIESLIKNGYYNPLPNYSPKKIERTLESINESKKYLYDIIIVVLKNTEEIDKYNLLVERKYPQLLLNDIIKRNANQYFDEGSDIYVEISITDNFIDFNGWCYIDYLDNSSTRREDYEKLFYIDDVENGLFDNIIKYHEYKPFAKNMYKPKKIERTLESFDQFKNFEKFDYDEIVIYVKNYREYYKLKENIKKYYNVDAPAEGTDLYPNYLFININRRISNTIKILFLTDNPETFDEDVETCVYGDDNVFPDIFTIDDIDKMMNIIRFGNNYENKPSYKPKKVERTLESYNTIDEATRIIVVLKKDNVENIKNILLDLDYTDYTDYDKDISDYVNIIFIDFVKKFFTFMKGFKRTLEEEKEYTIDMIKNDNQYNAYDYTYEKVFIYPDEQNEIISIMTNRSLYRSQIPNYRPRRTERVLEKSSLTTLGVPREVMQSIQNDFALSPDAQWERIRLKRKIEDILNNSDENELILQISSDSIKVFVSYNFNKERIYFIDSYIMKDTGWGGEYDKLKREFTTKTQVSYQIDSRSLVYHLNSDFSLNKQAKRIEFKREKEFTEFTENFKKDFLENFNSILKRIVGMKYQDAKKEIKNKARQIELENEMLISGLDDPLKGPNSLTILDEFLYQFEDEYSEFFGERIDLQELCNYFTRDKVLTIFMYYIYTGKIITK